MKYWFEYIFEYIFNSTEVIEILMFYLFKLKIGNYIESELTLRESLC